MPVHVLKAPHYGFATSRSQPTGCRTRITHKFEFSQAFPKNANGVPVPFKLHIQGQTSGHLIRRPLHLATLHYTPIWDEPLSYLMIFWVYYSIRALTNDHKRREKINTIWKTNCLKAHVLKCWDIVKQNWIICSSKWKRKTLIKITAFNFVFKLARARAHKAVGLFGSWDRCCKRPHKNFYLTIFNSSFKYHQHFVFKLDILLVFKEESLQVKLCKIGWVS